MDAQLKLGPFRAKVFRNPLRKAFFSSLIGKVAPEDLRITFGVLSRAVFRTFTENGIDKDDVVELEVNLSFEEGKDPEIKIVVWKFSPAETITRVVNFQEELEGLRKYREEVKNYGE